MNTVVLNKVYSEPPICLKEILRYAGCKEEDKKTLAQLQECLEEARQRLAYKVCYCELQLKTNGNICDFDLFSLQSEKLALNLKGCKKVILFAATLGVEIDRLIGKYGRISPSKALFFQAIGTERIEALCNAFCDDIAKDYNMGQSPRFSAGYGDLPLDAQKNIFAILNPEKRIGLTLTGSLLMSPSKSVTAFVGLGGEEKPIQNKCSVCDMQNCKFRGV